jgi:methionyl aminopeptidase
MTEKNYSGTVSYGVKNTTENTIKSEHKIIEKKKEDNNENSEELSKSDLDNYIKAGKIASEAVKYAKSIVKKDMSLLEIAEKIEDKIKQLGGKPAFPVNLSINEIAAHATPSFNDTDKAHGLLKVDIGAHIQGCIADTAFSIDLENSAENKKLIESAEKALENAIKEFNLDSQLGNVGKIIETTIKNSGFQPIINLSGHSIEKNNVHAGLTVPNYDTKQKIPLEKGVYAIEPFTTNGLGTVRDGKLSGIYHLERPGNVRDQFAREVLQFIQEEYETLPFCSRWIYKKFGSRGLLALKQIEQQKLLHHYPQLIEQGKGKVAQAEHTIILDKNKIITTL